MICGAASRWWLHESLEKLAEDVRARGAELVIRRGASLVELRDVAQETGAEAVHWNRRHEPAIMARDRDRARGVSEAEGPPAG
jgi:deoxyribodipyrimidine photo-lyase